jgi:hypothetical protein
LFYFRVEAKQSQIEANRSEKLGIVFSFEAKWENRKRTRKLAKQNKAKK